jgi:glycosyltransferase involved in cell wall biosynthesis
MHIVAYLDKGYPPDFPGGAEKRTAEFARALVRRGHCVTILTGVTRSWNDRGVEIIGTGRNRVVIEKEMAKGDVLWLWLAGSSFHGLTDIVRRSAKPIVYCCYTSDEPPPPYHGQVKAYMYETEPERQACGSRAGSVTIYPAINPADYPPSPSAGHYVMKVNANKTNGGLMFWDVVKRCPEIPFLLVKGVWGDQIIPDPVPENVLVADSTPDIQRLFADSRLLLTMCPRDPIGCVGIEAACSGVPTISNDTPQHREAYGIAGTFVPYDAEAYAKALRKLQDPDTYRAARENALAFAATLPAENVRSIERMVEVFARAAAGQQWTEDVPAAVPFSFCIPARLDPGIQGAPQRRTVFEWQQRYLRAHFPEAEIVLGDDEGANPVNRSRMRNRAAAKATNDVLVFMDADIIPQPEDLRSMVMRAANGETSGSHEWLYYSTPAQTEEVLASDPHAAPSLPPSSSAGFRHASRWGGPLIVMPRSVLATIGGWDEHFDGWGAEDCAIRHAITTLDRPMSYIGGHTYHLWHPPATDRAGSPHYKAVNGPRYEKYKRAQGNRAAMAKLCGVSEASPPPAVASTLAPHPSLSYIIPFADSGCPHRKLAYDWVLRYVQEILCPAFPGEIVRFENGAADHLADNRAAMRNLLLDASSGEVCVIIDADSYASREYLRSALAAVQSKQCWCGAESFAYLTPEQTRRVYATNTLPASPQTPRVNRYCTGGVLVVPRAAIAAVNGYDEHFVGWGYEDTCFGLSLDILWAPRVRIAGNAGHLWHPERVRPPADSPGRVRMRDTYCMATQKWDVVPGQFVPGDPASVEAIKRIVAGNRVVTGKG